MAPEPHDHAHCGHKEHKVTGAIVRFVGVAVACLGLVFGVTMSGVHICMDEIRIAMMFMPFFVPAFFWGRAIFRRFFGDS